MVGVKWHLALVVAGLVTVLLLAGQLARAAAGPEPNDPQDSLPAFATDGVRVAFEREVPGGRHVLSMTSAGKEFVVDSGRARLRGYVPGTTHLLIQSSDSESLVITGSRYDGPLAFLHGTDATASPDGSRVAYLRAGTLYIANIDGSGERAISTGVAPPSWDVVGPAWSPDGTRIAISSGSSLLLVNADGSGPKGPLERPEPECEPLMVGGRPTGRLGDKRRRALGDLGQGCRLHRLRLANAAYEPDGELSLSAVLPCRAEYARVHQ